MSEPIEVKPAWILGWEAGASSVTAILEDLIAELREAHGSGYDTDDGSVCNTCAMMRPCPSEEAASHAEYWLDHLPATPTADPTTRSA